MFFISPGRLKRMGILGMNSRNANHISRYNKRSLYPYADNKIWTKEMCLKAGIPVPELYGRIQGTFQLRGLAELLSSYEDFVVKPCRGSGGEGILVIASRDKKPDHFIRASQQIISLEELQYHIRNTIHGLYSLGGQPDEAIIEYRVKVDPLFTDIAVRGVPDIRVITFLGVPVMAMLRLPTYRSGGRANLHQGAVGVGIEMSSGRTMKGVQKTTVISKHPDTGATLEGVQLPGWDKILRMASTVQTESKLGYLGVDIVLDEEKGPLILEINARPGLAVQIANGEGLAHRLKLVESAHSGLKTLDERIQFATNAFQSLPDQKFGWKVAPT